MPADRLLKPPTPPGPGEPAAPGPGVPGPVAPPSGSVAALARGAIGWSVLNTLVGRLGSTFVGILLARILMPEDYGIFAVALVALNALLSVNELGVSLAVVRWPGDVARIAPTVVSLSLASSLVLWGAVFAVAPRIAELMNAPQAAGVLRLLSVGVLVDAVTAVPAALMTREFMQKQRLFVDLAGFVVTSTLAVGLAAQGFGAWSLAWSALVGNILNGVLIVRYAPRWFNPGFDRAIARSLLAFGLPLALASLLVFGLLNLDYVIVGGATAPAALGFYLLAFNLSTWPVTLFSAPARRISMPAFARLEAGEGSASSAFVTACTAMIAVTVPACLLLALFARPAIAVVYGDKWNAAAAVLPWLMVLALARVIGELAYDFLVALDRARSTLAVQALWLVALVPALLIGVRLGGIQGVAIGHAIVSLAVALPAYAVVVGRAGVSLPDLARGLVRPALALLLSGAAGLLVLALADADLVQLLLGGAVVAGLYLAVVYPMRRSLLPAGIGTP